jgi:hypothetical protein
VGSSGGVLTGSTPATTVLEAPAPPSPPEAAPTSFYCSWCGKERRSDSYALHHCGSRTRPPVFCSSCGRGLEQLGEYCGSCGTETSRLSPSA